MLTPFENLIKDEIRKTLPEKLVLEETFEHIYWRSGAIEKSTGKPAKILVNFNNKYDELFREELNVFAQRNLYSRYLSLSDDFRNAVKTQMIDVEKSILTWKIAHLKAVTAHIKVYNAGTGGTEWNKYLPLKNQKVFYFPEFWIGLDVENEIKKMTLEYPDKMIEELKIILK